MYDPVYVLIRTSSRPKYFANCYQSIKEQTYPNIITIVHTDDPKDDYVKGDIIIESLREPKKGRGHYNLYCNKLLQAIPVDKLGRGWYHFIDDDDMYFDVDVIEKTVKKAKINCVNVIRSKRWNNNVWPLNWGTQRSYQSECFFMHTDHKDLARWWSRKGGDHNYSRQLTDKLRINWIDGIIICKAQEGKGRGLRYDLGEAQKPKNKIKVETVEKMETTGIKHAEEVWVMVKYLRRVTGRSIQRGRPGESKAIPLKYAQRLQNLGKIEIIKEIKL